jgi:hypothetical protein
LGSSLKRQDLQTRGRLSTGKPGKPAKETCRKERIFQKWIRLLVTGASAGALLQDCGVRHGLGANEQADRHSGVAAGWVQHRSEGTKVIRWTGLILIFGILSVSVSFAENETERVQRAIRPQLDNLAQCYLKSSAAYAERTCESAEIIVQGAYAKCAPEENEVSRAMRSQAPYLNERMVDAYLDGTRSGAKRSMLRAILDKRAEIGNCR